MSSPSGRRCILTTVANYRRHRSIRWVRRHDVAAVRRAGVNEAVGNGTSPSRALHLWVGARTDTGRVRANNQDAIGTWQDQMPQTVQLGEAGYLFSVAVGVG